MSESRPTVGLVLGAGGIRGCAHAGVIRVLADAGVPIDLVVGASIGSMFGLGLASGIPAERIAAAARDSHPLDVLRFYTGRLRPGRNNPIGRMLMEAGEGKDFSDLPLPFGAVATDMATREAILHRQGPVLRAVQGSIALPFIARPVEIDGAVYVDGGLLDTAPVRFAREMGANVVITVCLGHNYHAPAFLRRRPWTRIWVESLGRQNCPPTPRWRDQIRFGCRLYAATYSPPIPAQDADVAIWPELGNLSPNSIFGARFCYDQGERAAWAALPEIERVLYSRSVQTT